MTTEHEEVLKRLTDARKRHSERKKAELAAELKKIVKTKAEVGK